MHSVHRILRSINADQRQSVIRVVVMLVLECEHLLMLVTRLWRISRLLTVLTENCKISLISAYLGCAYGKVTVCVDLAMLVVR